MVNVSGSLLKGSGFLHYHYLHYRPVPPSHRLLIGRHACGAQPRPHTKHRQIIAQTANMKRFLRTAGCWLPLKGLAAAADMNGVDI